MPELKLSPAESESFFFNALCNGLGTLKSYGLELCWKKEDYTNAKKGLQKKMESGAIPKEDICFEDVLMEILRIGKSLELFDHENGEKPQFISMSDVHERVSLAPFDHLSDMIEERDDAVTADVILQTVFYQEVIFG